MLTWWVGTGPPRPESLEVGSGRRILGNVSEGRRQTDLLEVVAPAQRVEARHEPCPAARPSEPNLHVRVVDQAGTAVAGAQIVRWDAHGSEELERSDSEGILVVSIPQCTGQSLAVRADGFATAYRDLGDRFPVQTIVQLSPDRLLRGRVVDMRGAPLPGMSVVGWPSHRRLSGREVARSAVAPALFSRASTDGAGRFVLQALDLGTTHTLIAGGQGYVVVDPVVVESTFRGEVELRLWRLHGLQLEIRSKGGGALVLPENLGTTGCTRFGHASDRSYRHVAPDSAQAVLSAPLGERVLREREYSLYETILLYASPIVSDRLGPIQYSFCAPGFARATGELWIPPLEDGVLAEETVALDQVAPVFGPLEIRLHGTPEQQVSPRHTAWGGALFVFARNVAVDSEYVLPLSDADVMTLDGLLPTGKTEFVLGMTEWQQPDWSAVLATLDLNDRDNVLDIDVSDYGGVEFTLSDSMGSAVFGPVQAELRDAKGGVLRHLEFHRAPYRAYGLGRGEYFVTVHRPYSPWDDSAHSEVFQIEPGGFVNVVCVPGEVKGR